jgi:lipopolysaccharide transport system ATP-binding protein
MGNIAIRAEHLWKQYTIGKAAYRPDTLRDRIVHGCKEFTDKWVKLQSADQSHETIWALKDASFEVQHGEVMGIIGVNGAGKSTLLKILSRITEPTKGRVEMYGRVGSLLEVGTGFHHELTGRENIYLYGAILGMKRVEMNRKFDEIVAFAEIEQFLDTPVKRYSSGMYMRLAFAVAAHLEPEILIVDEVLAVGDARFQAKCLKKMQDVGHQGRTVLFVSHNMPAVTRLCERAILLDGGSVVRNGTPHSVVTAYLTSGLGTTAAREWDDPAKAPGSEVVRLCAVRVRAKSGQVTDTVDVREPVYIELEYIVLKPGYMQMPHLQFYREDGIHAFSAHDLDPAWRRRPRPVGRFVSMVEVPGDFLSEGTMFVGAGLDTVEPHITQFYAPDAVAFQVIEKQEGVSARGDYGGEMSGVVRPLLQWTTQFTPNSHPDELRLHADAEGKWTNNG